MTGHDYLIFTLLVALGSAAASWAEVLYVWLLRLRAHREAGTISRLVFLFSWLLGASGGLLSIFAMIVVIRVMRLGTKPVTTIEEAAGFIVVATAVIVFYLRRRWSIRFSSEKAESDQARAM
jgi:hypothetical protein